MASIIERINFDCPINLMLAIISLTAPNDAILSTGYSHANVPVWSYDEALAGGVNSLLVHRADQEPKQYHFASNVSLKKVLSD